MPCSLWILTTYLPWPWPPLIKVRKRAKTGLFRKSERPNAKRHDYTPQDCRPLLLAQAGYLRPIRLAEVDHGLPLLGHSPRSVSVFTGANPCTGSSSEKITWERKNPWRSAGRGAGWKASGWLEKRPPPPRDSSRCKPESPLFHVHCPASSVLLLWVLRSSQKLHRPGRSIRRWWCDDGGTSRCTRRLTWGGQVVDFVYLLVCESHGLSAQRAKKRSQGVWTTSKWKYLEYPNDFLY